ncbi:MAG: YihY/virulence factor BrkB family protein, partial [Pseudohongiellaceae bacterium]
PGQREPISNTWSLMPLQFAQLKDLVNEGKKRIEQFLWQRRVDALPWWQRFIVRSCQITVAVIRDLTQGQLSLRAMSLVFTTLIGFFPLLALSFAVLKSFGVHNAVEPTLQALLEPLGERSSEFTGQILNYVDNMSVEVIGITSVGLLLYIVLDMMRKIELAFNYIWAVKHARSWSSRISEYLFAVIVSPMLLFFSISLTASINANFFEELLTNMPFGLVLLQMTAGLASILLMSLAFAFAYSFLPNTRVHFSSAFIGGLITTIIWKLMGLVFAEFFITSARESIYLAFASAIVIMFFIYIGWLVALIGSSIAFYHQHPAKTRTGRGLLQLSIAQRENLALAVAATIIERFNKGGRALTEEELIATLASNPSAVGQALDEIQEIGLITATYDDPPRYLPAHAVDQCTLVEIWQALRRSNSDVFSTGGDAHEMTLVRDFQDRLNSTVERELGEIKFTDVLSTERSD